MWNIVITALSAGCGAGFIAVGGYLKSTKKEEWSWTKFLRTFLVSSLFGACASYFGVTSDIIANSTIGIFADSVIENWLKAIFKENSKLRNL